MTSITPGFSGYQTYQYHLPPTTYQWQTSSTQWAPGGLQWQWSAPAFGSGSTDPFASMGNLFADPMAGWMMNYAMTEYNRAMSPYGPGGQMNQAQMNNVMDSVFGPMTQYYGGGYTPQMAFNGNPNGFGQQPYAQQSFGQQPFAQQGIGFGQDPLAQMLMTQFG